MHKLIRLRDEDALAKKKDPLDFFHGKISNSIAGLGFESVSQRSRRADVNV